ncbi:hypothetical protein BJX65DRAFT_287060 [Aspergillus insuetus]
MVDKRQKPGIFTYARFNVNALLALAHSIRGKECPCDEAQHLRSGSLNWIILISFKDGIKWVFRSPRRSFGLEKATTTEVLLSEVPS